MTDRREIIRNYKDTPRQSGVYQIRNLRTGRIFVGAALDVPGKLNSHRFQSRMTSHRNRGLQQDWPTYGPDAFAFEMLDVVKPSDTPDYDPTEDLQVLEALWLEKLQPFGDNGYNVVGRRI